MSITWTPKDIAINIMCRKIANKATEPGQKKEADNIRNTTTGFIKEIWLEHAKKWLKNFDDTFEVELESKNKIINNHWINSQYKDKNIPLAIINLIATYSESPTLINNSRFIDKYL